MKASLGCNLMISTISLLRLGCGITMRLSGTWSVADPAAAPACRWSALIRRPFLRICPNWSPRPWLRSAAAPHRCPVGATDAPTVTIHIDPHSTSSAITAAAPSAHIKVASVDFPIPDHGRRRRPHDRPAAQRSRVAPNGREGIAQRAKLPRIMIGSRFPCVMSVAARSVTSRKSSDTSHRNAIDPKQISTLVSLRTRVYQR